MRKNKRIARAYSQDALTRVLTMPESEFGRAYGMETTDVVRGWKSYRDEDQDYYHFRDNGSNVLAVAHLDTVVTPKGRRPHFRNTHNGPVVTSGALDDRLGAYVILELLPKLGVTCDWLLTVGEESGCSTAEYFKTSKDYHWVIEFDRGGMDVVMYQFEDADSRDLVEAAGATMGSGSFSDIASLEHLGVKAFNWGVGYQGNYHSPQGYAFLGDTFSMVAKYLRFHEQNAGQVMTHDEGSYYSSRDDFYLDCDWCGTKRSVDTVTWYCTYCGACQDCGSTDPKIAEEWNDPDVDVCMCYTPASSRGSWWKCGLCSEWNNPDTKVCECVLLEREEADASLHVDAVLVERR